jgi:hypothetical protein
MRGNITEKIQQLAKKHLGREITQKELRLMPYVQHVMINEQILDPSKINGDERRILQKWREEKHIEGGAAGLAITKEFWDALCEILWEGYVIGGAQ